MARILEVCSYLYPALNYGGPAKVVYDLSRELAKKHQVTIYTTDVWDANSRLPFHRRLSFRDSFRVVYFRNIWNSLAFRQRLFTSWRMPFTFIREHRQFDIVHLHDIFIPAQLLIGMFAIILKIPLIISPHGVIDPVRMQRKALIKKIMWLIAQPILQSSKALIATSDQEKKDLETMGFSKVVTVWNGVPANTVQPSHSFSQFDHQKLFTFLYVGKLHPQKGLLELVRALEDSNIEAQLLLAGPDDGAEQDIRRYVELHHLKNVHLLGFVDDAQKQELFHLADIFVYPSYAEGFSISILEALQSGLPVLITEQCNFPDVKKYEAGVIIDANDLEKQLLSALTQVAGDRKKLASYSDNARKLVDSKYSIAMMAKSMETLYAQCSSV